MSSSISYRSILRPKLISSYKSTYFLDSISDRRFNHFTANFPLPETFPSPRILNPHCYCPWTRGWRPFMSAPGRYLDQGSLLKVVSWNINSTKVGRASRASSAMDHLEEVFGSSSSPLVVMLSEVHHESLSAILEHPWIRKNFKLSNAQAPRRYFTLMMVSQHTQTDRWFRVPFQSRTDRDLLVVDIPTSSINRGSAHPRKILRLCTTHLDHVVKVEGKEPRPHQLAQASALLKALPTHGSEIIAGLVGGDMNYISDLDAASHKAADVDLCDVWEDPAHSLSPRLEKFKELTRKTWGHQQRRQDKFFYTGMVDVVPLSEVRDLTGKIGQLGRGVKTRVKTWEYNIEPLGSIGRMLMLGKSYSDIYREGGVRRELKVWVSDHIGITIGLRVRQDPLRQSD